MGARGQDDSRLHRERNGHLVGHENTLETGK